MEHTFSRYRTLAAGALIAVSLVACSGGGSSTPAPPPPPPTQGTVSVAVTGVGACDFEAVNLTVTKFRLNKASTFGDSTDPNYPGWIDVPLSTPHKINPFKLMNGVRDVLGEVSVEPGHYLLASLVLDTNESGTANTIVPAAGASEQPLEIDSAFQAGIQVAYVEYDVVAGQKTDLVLNVDMCAAVAAMDGGRYLLRWGGVSQRPASDNGISGYVAASALSHHVIVSAQGLTSVSTMPDPVTGAFKLSGLPAGNYDVVITSENSAASVVGKVPVDATATTLLSTREAPIQLASSEVGSISGSVSVPSSAPFEAYVSAKQAYAPDSWLVTIKRQNLNAVTGDYSLSKLPLAAPQYAVYETPLPLKFSTSTAATPGSYHIEANWAPFYPPASTTGETWVDISAGDKAGINLEIHRCVMCPL